MRRTLLRRDGSHPGQPTAANHIQCGGGCGGLPLGSLVVELYRGDISGDKEDVAQTTGMMIWNGYDGQRRAEEEHQRLMVRAELLYANERMVASTDPGWLQSAFDTPTGIFDRVGPQENFSKTGGMVCRPCQETGVRADEVYTWRMTGEGQSFKERQQ